MIIGSIYEYLVKSSHHLIINMNEQEVNLEPVISSRLVCNNCRINVAEISKKVANSVYIVGKREHIRIFRPS